MIKHDKNDFLLLTADLNELPTEGDRDIVESINSKFSKNSFYFEIQGDQILFS
jgi:hypothetical protein